MSDLPVISNGALDTEIAYGGEPIAHFQRQVHHTTMTWEVGNSLLWGKKHNNNNTKTRPTALKRTLN